MPYTCPTDFNICMNDGWCYNDNGDRNTAARNRVQSCAPPTVQGLALRLMNEYVAGYCRDPAGGRDPIMNVSIEDPRIPDDAKLNIELKWAGVDTRDFTTGDYDDIIRFVNSDDRLMRASDGPSNTFEQHHDHFINKVTYAMDQLEQRGGAIKKYKRKKTSKRKKKSKGGKNLRERKNTKRKVRRNMKRKSMKRKSMKRKSY